MRHYLAALLVAVFAATASFVQGQEAADQRLVLPSPIMVIDFERVFGETLYGRRIAADLDVLRQEVQAENDRLFDELVAEESALTEARTTMDPDAFREAADAFNTKAQSVRASREAEQTRLVSILDAERSRFIERIQPVIADMMVERGAIVAMDRRSVIRAIGSANATDDVIASINNRLGDGTRDPGDRPPARPGGDAGTEDQTIIVPELDDNVDGLSGTE